jgi:hypothetical protein
VIDRSFAQSLEDYEQQVAGTDNGGVALFSPVLEIYDRHDFRFSALDVFIDCVGKTAQGGRG